MMNTQSMLGTTGEDQMPGMAQAEPQLGQGMAPPEPVDPDAQMENYIDFANSEDNLAKKILDKEDKDCNNIL